MNQVYTLKKDYPLLGYKKGQKVKLSPSTAKELGLKTKNEPPKGAEDMVTDAN